MLDSQLQIQTPEQVRLRFTLAGIGSRALAQMVDLSLLGIVYAILIFAAVFITTGNTFGSGTPWATAIIVILSFLVFWGYFIVLEYAMSGQTLGKRFVHIRSVRKDGRPITFYGVVVRNILRLIDFLPGGYLLGVIVMIVDRNERRLGDLLASTVVIVDEGLHQMLPPQLTATESKSAGVQDAPARWVLVDVRRAPVQIYIAKDLPTKWYLTLQELHRRHRKLAKATRNQIVHQFWRDFTALEQVRVVSRSSEVQAQFEGDSNTALQMDMELILIIIDMAANKMKDAIKNAQTDE